MPEILFTVDPALVVQLLLAVILPIIVGFVTTRVTKAAVKTWILTTLTLVSTLLTGLGSAIAADAPFDLGLALILAIPSFAISVATYYGFWKPTGIGQAVQDIEPTTLFK